MNLLKSTDGKRNDSDTWDCDEPDKDKRIKRNNIESAGCKGADAALGFKMFLKVAPGV